MGQGNEHSTSRGSLLFARHFFKEPGMLGSIIPSSRYLVDKLLGPVDWSRARYMVEYGPGVGTITREIVRRMRDDAHLLAIELNDDLAHYLEDEFADEERVTVIRGSAENIDSMLSERGWEGFDYGFSGIPFSTLPETLRDDILGKTRTALLPGGEFVVFQFSNKVLPHLRNAFDHVDRDFVLLNILPAHCYRCTGESAEPRADAG